MPAQKKASGKRKLIGEQEIPDLQTRPSKNIRVTRGNVALRIWNPQTSRRAGAMHSEVVQDRPGKMPEMRMTLEQKKTG
jgi:hypothetical protein